MGGRTSASRNEKARPGGPSLRHVVQLLARLNAKVNLIAPKPGPGIPFDTPDPGVASFRQLSGARCRVLSASSVDSTSTLPTDS